MGTISALPAGTDWVVDRAPEWDLVANEIDARHAGSRKVNSVIDLYGPEGIGKTTFLRKVLLPSLQQNRLPHVLLSLDSKAGKTRYSGPYARGHLIIDLAEGLARSADIKLPKSFSRTAEQWQYFAAEDVEGWVDLRRQDAEKSLTETFTQSIIPEVLTIRGEKPDPIVIMVDGADTLDSETLEWLQQNVQTKTTDTGYVLFVMASHFRLECYPFYLRDYYYWLRLAPFDLDEVREQIEKAGFGAIADDVYGLSFGLPGATKAITNRLAKLAKEDIDLEPQDLFDRHYDELVRVVARLKKRYLSDIDDEVISGMTVLSPFRLFNISIVNQLLPTLLRGYKHYEPRKKTPIDPTTFIRLLQKTRRVAWDTVRNGYVIEEPVRQIVARVLEEEDPALYRAVHERALEKYNEWRETIPEKRKDYLVEAMYHQAALTLLSNSTPKNRATAIRQLREMFLATVDQYAREDDPQKHNATLTEELEKKIEDDGDLRFLLGDTGIQAVLEGASAGTGKIK